MNPDPTDVLNRLVVIHHRSLSSYLDYASPTWQRGDEQARAELQRVVADQREMADRLGEMVVDKDGVVRYGGYPMEFTGYHDLSFDFLLEKLIQHQRRDVTAIEQCVEQLGSDLVAQSLAQEALGMAKGHLESLEELKRSAVS